MSMKNIQLPKDIVKYVKKKIIGYVALFVLLECAAIVINVLTWEYFAARTPLPFHIGVIVWICIVPFIILKFPFKLILNTNRHLLLVVYQSVLLCTSTL